MKPQIIFDGKEVKAKYISSDGQANYTVTIGRGWDDFHQGKGTGPFKKIKKDERKSPQLCACGCGGMAKSGNWMHVQACYNGRKEKG